jgi:sigma-B regulation protein RsbU (phosphoserine phosphatase)
MELSNRMPVDEVEFLEEEAQQFVAAMAKVLSSPDDLDAALVEVLCQVADFLGAEEASIFLVDQSTHELVFSFASGAAGAKAIGFRLQSGQGVVGWVVNHSEDLIVPYPGLDERFFAGVDASTGFTTRSILCGPIRAQGQPIGAIEVVNKRVGTFNDDDLVLLRTITHLVAKVIPDSLLP